MEVILSHDGATVTGTEAKMHRFPKTTCPRAIEALHQLRGFPLASDRKLLFDQIDRGSQCTHLLDMAALLLSAMARGLQKQVAEIAVTDRDRWSRQQVIIEVGGVCALDLKLCDETLTEPVAFSGRKLFGGYARWVEERFGRSEADLWHMAQMAVFVARGRAYVVDGPHPRNVRDEPMRAGACHSFSEPAFSIGHDNIGYVRDHTRGLPTLNDSKY